MYIRDVLLMIPMYLNWYLRPKIRQNGFSERDGMKSRRCLSYKLESCANVLLNVPVNCPAIIPKIYRKTYNVIKYWHLFVFSLDSSYNCQLLAVFSILLHASFSFPTRSCKRNKPKLQCYCGRHLFFHPTTPAN